MAYFSLGALCLGWSLGGEDWRGKRRCARATSPAANHLVSDSRISLSQILADLGSEQPQPDFPVISQQQESSQPSDSLQNARQALIPAPLHATHH